MMNIVGKREAAQEMFNRWFSSIPSELLTRGDYYEDYLFYVKDDSEGDSEDDSEDDCGDGITYGGEPMWSRWFLVEDSYAEDRIRGDMAAVCDLGFTVIEEQENGYLFLGIDGAGYDFYEAHWIPLYDFLGLHWHTEAA